MEHLSRPQQIAMAAGSRNDRANRHLEACGECAELVGLYSSFSLAGRPGLPSAPPSWVSKAMAVSALNGPAKVVTRLVARLKFDSWASNLVLGVRGRVADERRLRFSAETATADLRAERKSGGWQFMARLDAAGCSFSDVHLEVDGMSLFPDPAGFVEWSGQAPREVAIVTPHYIIALPTVPWFYEK